MKTTTVSIAGGAVATNITANIAAKFVKIVEAGSTPSEGLLVQQLNSDGTFSPEVGYPPGVPIRLKQLENYIAAPPNFFASGVPATGGIYAKIRTQDAATITVKVEEWELIPPGED
jgi:hypothetical protein